MDTFNTQLKDRLLWYDGKSAFKPTDLLRCVSLYDVEFVTEINDMVTAYNRHVPKNQELKVKTSCDPLSTEWNIPREYLGLDIITYLYDKHAEITSELPTAEIEEREERLVQEILKYQQFGLLDVLRAIVWIINTLTAHNVVWGVGRGSSVSSYVLYVIGVHDVDSHAYGLDVDDFLHE